MTERPRVLLLIPHLGGGGAERVTELLARSLSSEKYEVHLGIVTGDSAREPLPPKVGVHALGARRVRAAAWRLLRLIRRLKPDVILSGMAHLNFLVLLLRPFYPAKARILVRQNGTVSSLLASGELPTYTRLLYRLLYPRADRVICQSPAMADDLTRELGIAEERLAVLPNPLDANAIREAGEAAPSLWAGPGPHLLAVGRLTPAKGFDLLLQALASVQMQFPDADLVIAGAGVEETALKFLCRELGLEEAVHLVGHIDCPWAHFPGATVFALSSRHEGLPNALLEAAAGGLPIVALPASGGVAGLLRAQPGVWLADEISAEALASSLCSAIKVLRPGERFHHAFIDEFRIQCAIPAYESLLDAVLQEANQ